MTIDADSAQNLIFFAWRAEKSRMLVVRGSVSTQVAVPIAESLSIVSGEDRLVLVGEDRGMIFSDVCIADVGKALAAEGAVIEAGAVRFPLNGDLTIDQVGTTTLMIEVSHRRADGRPSGAIDRMILTALSGPNL